MSFENRNSCGEIGVGSVPRLFLCQLRTECLVLVPEGSDLTEILDDIGQRGDDDGAESLDGLEHRVRGTSYCRQHALTFGADVEGHDDNRQHDECHNEWQGSIVRAELTHR